MHSLMLVLHVSVCFILILVVLLQAGKGADIGSAFGGGSSNTLFGASGPQSFLGKLTTAAAVVFMGTSLFLAALSSREVTKSVISEQTVQIEEVVPEKPAQTTANEEKKSETAE